MIAEAMDRGTLWASFAADYAEALAAYAGAARETDLLAAFNLARAGMSLGISLSDLCDLHHTALARLPDAALPDRTRRAGDFLLEALSVYDMALRGHLDTIGRLRQEVAERQRIESDLREAGLALARQRDTLEQEVQARTRQVVLMLEDLRRSNAELRQTSQEQAEFTYAISHDLKSPTNTILSLLTALSEDFGETLPEGARQLIELQTGTARRMLRLIGDLTNYANAINAELRLLPVALDQVLADVVDDLRAEIGEAGARVELGPLPVVRGDETQLRLLFQNLLANAVKFRRPGAAPQVQVRATGSAAGLAVIEVQDDGIGIPVARINRIFGLFQRLHAHHEYPGTGLGLAVCKRIATKHDGAIEVTSAPGGGAVFRVHLPPASERDGR